MQRADVIEKLIEEDHDCNDCKWYAPYEGVCCNGDSPYRAEFRFAYDICELWEEEDDTK